MVDEELGGHIKEVRVYDDSKEISPFHLKRESSRKIRTIYSDHNPIVVETDLVMMKKVTSEESKKTVLTKEGRIKYGQDLQRRQVSKLLEGSGT